LPDPITAPVLRALLVSLLAGATGKSEAHWRTIVRRVEVHLITDPGRIACNRAVDVAGSAADREAVAKAVELVRGEHPCVR